MRHATGWDTARSPCRSGLTSLRIRRDNRAGTSFQRCQTSSAKTHADAVFRTVKPARSCRSRRAGTLAPVAAVRGTRSQPARGPTLRDEAPHPPQPYVQRANHHRRATRVGRSRGTHPVTHSPSGLPDRRPPTPPSTGSAGGWGRSLTRATSARSGGPQSVARPSQRYVGDLLSPGVGDVAVAHASRRRCSRSSSGSSSVRVMPAAGWLSTISLSARLCPHRGGHGGACRMAFRLGSRDSAGTPTSRPALITRIGIRGGGTSTLPRHPTEERP